MEEEIDQSTTIFPNNTPIPPLDIKPDTSIPSLDTKPKKSSSSTGFLVILLLVSLGLAGFFGYKYWDLSKRLETKVPEPYPIETPSNTPTPTPNNNNPEEEESTPSPSPLTSPSPTPTPTPRPFSEEEPLMRRTLSGFESYIANSNTAGALTFFTPPVTEGAINYLSSIQGKNLPFRLTSWKFIEIYENNKYQLAIDTIKNGYRVRMIECRTNSEDCPILFIELVRSNEAENGFEVYRYYDTRYAYQNNLGEEIKYQGFGF